MVESQRWLGFALASSSSFSRGTEFPRRASRRIVFPTDERAKEGGGDTKMGDTPDTHSKGSLSARSLPTTNYKSNLPLISNVEP